MAKYTALGEYLRAQRTDEVRMTFAEIERVIGARLPPKAQHHRAWWSNSPSNNVMTREWLDAGFRSEQVDMAGRKLVLRRAAEASERSQPGLGEAGRMYKHEEAPATKVARHPAIGSMKGLITVAPGVDLTEPVYTEEEWNEILKEMDRDWDEIVEGLKRPE